MLGMRREKEANQKREEVEGDPRDGKGGWGGGLAGHLESPAEVAIPR